MSIKGRFILSIYDTSYPSSYWNHLNMLSFQSKHLNVIRREKVPVDIHYSVMAKLAKPLTRNTWRWRGNMREVELSTGERTNPDSHRRAKR